MPEYTSPLMARLKEIMPKKPEQPWDGKSLMHIELHPIRQAADSFTHWLDGQMPDSDEEMRAMLWVFGEILNGEMERQLNGMMERVDELVGLLPTPAMHLNPEEDYLFGRPYPAKENNP